MTLEELLEEIESTTLWLSEDEEFIDCANLSPVDVAMIVQTALELHRNRKCVICGIDTLQIDEHYMVHDALWDKFGVRQGKLCVGCFELRLGRSLDKDDFSDVPLNRIEEWPRSERLSSRLNSQ